VDRPLRVRAGLYRYRGFIIKRIKSGWRIVGEPRATFAKLQQAIENLDRGGNIYWFRRG
jgi:hypothetical protein